MLLFNMRIVLRDEAYAQLETEAKAKNMTTQQLGAEIIRQHLVIPPK